MATLDDLLRELPAAARPAARKAWEALPPRAREGLEHALGDLPSDLTRFRTLLELGLEHAKMAAGGKSRVAIVGPANVGKSTLFNRLLRAGEARAAAGPVPGTTRVTQEGDAGAFAVVDTPGADAVGEVGEAEKARALAVAREADVLVVIYDAVQGIKREERALFDELASLGKPFVVGLNKVDLVGRDRDRVREHAARALGLETGQVIPFVAKDGRHVDKLLAALARAEPRVVAALGAALPAYRRTLAFAATRRAAATAAAIALVPLPMLDVFPLLALQSSLVLGIARVFRYRITLARLRELLATFGLGFFGRTLFQELSKLGGPPGWALAAAIAASTTAAMGYASTLWFERGESLTRERVQALARTLSGQLLERLRGFGRRRPGRQKVEEAVEAALEGLSNAPQESPPPQGPKGR
jgi:small GTP-binding protein